MAAGLAGGMMLDGARQFAGGRRPSFGDLLMTPANALKVTNQLAQLRGAAMKLGQLVSMDAGEMLPPEMADILSRLRADAEPMPQKQLQAVLDRRWGKDWRGRFDRFSFRPMAAASIGQVHRARTPDGRELAIKIQYPGVRDSIDSDVDNVATLMRLSGLVPKTLDVEPMLREAKRQLHEEADYEREGQCLRRFAELLKDRPDYLVPELYDDLTGPSILAMSFAEGVAVESLVDAPQEERDRIATLLIDLVLRELFEFGLMQTDPNFANYRYDRATGRLVLLDFGATRSFPPELPEAYAKLLSAGLANDAVVARNAALDIGLFDLQTPEKHQDAVMRAFELAMQPLRQGGIFDFGTSDVVAQLRDEGMAIAADRDFWHIPPIDMLFLQRKLGGVYLLATRLKARVEVRALLERSLDARRSLP